MAGIFYPIAANEAERVGSLRDLLIIGTSKTPSFDALASHAADVFHCPISFISFLDEHEQWLKAECGLGTSSTPRSVAFCNYTILSGDVFTIADTLLDPRFANNPQVTKSPHIRFYAGAPITSGGQRVGAMCVADTKPRAFGERDKKRLQGYALIAEGLVATYSQAASVSAAAQLVWKKNQLLQQVERIGKIGGWELDLLTQQIAWSDEVSRIHDLPTLEPCSLEDALSFYPGKWRSTVEANVEHTIATGEPYQFEAEFITAQGRCKWVRAAGECEFRDGKAVRLFGMFQDITSEKAASERMWRAANCDEVTGLGNRRYFNRALDEAIARCTSADQSLSLLILDLDNFKQINDSRGHGVGDQVLAEVGRRLAIAVPTGDIVARLGGDEFALTLSGDSNTNEFCAQVLRRLRQPVRVGNSHIYVGGTIGVARYPEDAVDAGDLLKKADIGLYSAKQERPGTAMTYSPVMAEYFERHDRAMELVRSALATRQLVPFYQPKVRLGDGVRTGFEALARIVGNEGVKGPSSFSPAFSDRVTARRIGRRMLQQVIADLSSWLDAGYDPGSISVNVSEFDFTDGKFVKRVLDLLDQNCVPRSCLTIEVTESVFLGEKATLAKKALIALDDEGVRIELDDFGTGYASLTHLRAIPVSRLKIDRSFVHNIESDEGNRSIVKAVIELGHNLNCEIVAEGVETLGHAHLLRAMGCDIGQGFLFDHPANAVQTRQLLLAEALDNARRLALLAKETENTPDRGLRTSAKA